MDTRINSVSGPVRQSHAPVLPHARALCWLDRRAGHHPLPDALPFTAGLSRRGLLHLSNWSIVIFQEGRYLGRDSCRPLLSLPFCFTGIPDRQCLGVALGAQRHRASQWGVGAPKRSPSWSFAGNLLWRLNEVVALTARDCGGCADRVAAHRSEPAGIFLELSDAV